MTFLELYGDALDTELASSDRTQLFTTARRKKEINNAMIDFVRLTHCTKRYGTIAISDGVSEYDIYATLTDFRRLDGAPSIKIVDGSDIRYIQGRDDFPFWTPEELDRLQPGWRTASPGTPAAWYVRDADGQYLLGMTPAPDVTGAEVWSWLVPYTAQPTAMSGDSDQPFTVNGNPLVRLRDYHQALVHYAAGKLEALRKNETGTNRQMGLYAALVAQYLQEQREDSQSQITLAHNYYRSRSAAQTEDWRR